MEVYGPVYRRGLKKILNRVKKVQEILGDLHDCDVWIDQVTLLLLQERALLRSDSTSKHPDAPTITSLIHFLQERKKERTVLHRRFMRYWEKLGRLQTWDELHKNLEAGRKTRFRPLTPCNETEAVTAVNSLAGQSPQVLDHSRHVTGLALMIFDNLQPLHHLEKHERFLLGCAGMLHDIGWKYGQKRHNTRGAGMILADETLPFDIPERCIIALVARSHRGNRAPETSGYFRLLSAEKKEQARVLAAILRIADGLDYLHLATVEAVTCIPEGEDIVVSIASTGDVSVEKQRAGSKSDLFSRVFNRNLVIR